MTRLAWPSPSTHYGTHIDCRCYMVPHININKTEPRTAHQILKMGAKHERIRPITTSARQMSHLFLNTDYNGVIPSFNNLGLTTQQLDQGIGTHSGVGGLANQK